MPGFSLKPTRNSFRLEVGIDLPAATAATGPLDKAELGFQLFAGTPVRFGFMVGSSEAEVRGHRARGSGDQTRPHALILWAFTLGIE